MITNTRNLFAKYTDAETFARIVEYGTVTEMWKRCVKEYDTLPAIVEGGNSYTYATLESDAAKMRYLLAEDGKESRRVALYCPNSYDFVKAFIAIVTLGYTAIVLPAHLPEMAVMGICAQYGADTLVYAPALAEKTGLVAEKLPHVRRISTDTAVSGSLEMRECNPETPCAVMFTGGTTGKSKGALLSNEALMQGVVNGCYGTRDVFNQKYLLILPLSHIFGLVRSMLTVLYTGGSVCICKNNTDMFRDAAMFSPQILVAVPAVAEMALALSKKFGKMMLGAELKYIICGAAAVPPYLIGEYEKLGVSLLPGYGLTESANLVSGNPECKKYPESVGIPYPNQELRFVNGELWLRGKNIFSGYLGSEEEAFEDGWFKTGDLAHLDENGLLYITGRIKEIIVLSNGENISPAEVEAEFNKLSYISDSLVFEGDDGKLALEVTLREAEMAKLDCEDPKAFVIEELRKINSTLLPYQRVNSIEIREKDFERTPSMKIVRKKK